MEIDYEIVKTVRELQKQKHQDGTIEEKLEELGYSQSQVKEIMRLAAGVDDVESEGNAKKVFMALIGGFVVLVALMAAFAIFLA